MKALLWLDSIAAVMHHQSEMKRRSWILILIFIAFAYVFFSISDAKKINPPSKNTFLPYSQARSLGEISENFSTGLPFIGRSYMGYIDTNSKMLYAQLSNARVAIDAKGWIFYSRFAETLELHDLTKKTTHLAAFAYPWFKSSWRILMRGDQMGVAKIDDQGTIQWQKEFPMQITALDANSEFIVIGLLNGMIYIFDKEGNRTICSLQNLGGLRTIYAIAISEDSDCIISLAGLSPQNIETFKKEDNLYTFAYATQVKQSSVLQASMAIARDRSYAIVARGSEVLYYNIKNNLCRTLMLPQEKNASRLAKGEGKPLYYTLGVVRKDQVALLRTIESDMNNVDVILLKDGILEREWIGASGIASNNDAFAVIFQDGVELQ